MIFITGDTHGFYDKFVERLQEKSPQDGDKVIICGDFGFVFSDDTEGLKNLEQLPFDILFVDGNHENFDKLCQYPVEKWNGGKIHRLSSNIIHLMRGQIFEFEGKSWFTMGGAYSVDRGHRIRGTSWWDVELPKNEEYHEASDNLKNLNFKVDYIITHDAPEYAIMKMGLYPNPRGSELTGFFEWIRRETDFNRWFFGHYHKDQDIDNKLFCLYNRVIRLF